MWYSIQNLTTRLAYLIVCVAALLNASSGVSQTAKIDSIRLVITDPAVQDSAKFFACSDMAIAMEEINLDSAFHYYDLAFNLAEENKWYKRMGHITFNRSFAYHYRLRSDTSIAILREAEMWYNKADYTTGILNCYFTLGTYWSNFEQFDSSIYYLQEARQMGETVQDTFFLNKVYNNLGLMYQYIGVYDLSIEYTIKAIELKEIIQSGDIERAYVNLGLSYASNELHEQALHYYRLAQKTAVEKNDTISLALITKNIGVTRLAQKEYDSAQVYFDKAYQLYETIGDSNSMSRAYLSLSDMALEQSKPEMALNYSEAALSIFPKQNPNIRLLMGLYIGVASAQIELAKQGDRPYWNKAISNANKALKLARETGLKVKEQQALELLFISEKTVGNYKQAVTYAEAFNEVSDSLQATERLNSLTEQQIRFQTEKKELAIEALNRENQLKSESLAQSIAVQEQQTTIIWILIIGLLIVIGLAVGVGMLYKRLTKQNELILAQKEEKEILLKEIHHRVKNNLQVVIALLELQDSALKNEQFSDAVKISQQRVRSMAMIHELLYKNDDVGKLDFDNYINSLLTQVRDSYANRQEVTYSVDLDSDAQFDLDTAIPLGLIITELFTNSMKYASSAISKTEVQVSCKGDHGKYVLEVKDNGGGLPAEFDLKKAKSLGIRLVHKLAKQLGGEVNYHFDQGAVFSINFQA